jgi:hypothetical protein
VVCPPEKWSSLKHGLWPDGGLRNAEEETQGGRGRDCREVATGYRLCRTSYSTRRENYLARGYVDLICAVSTTNPSLATVAFARVVLSVELLLLMMRTVAAPYAATSVALWRVRWFSNIRAPSVPRPTTSIKAGASNIIYYMRSLPVSSRYSRANMRRLFALIQAERTSLATPLNA